MITPNRQMGFMHVPRTAGGSIVNELMKTNWVILGHDVTSPHYMHLSKFRKIHPLKEAYFIGAVRNPYDRLVSAYHFLKAGGDNEMDKKDAEKFINQFDSFETFVLKQFSWLKSRSTLKQIHLKPQYYWITKSNKLLIDQLFKFEQLDKLFDFVVAHSEIKHEMISHVHASKHSNYQDYYSTSMKKLVQRAYYLDFKLFNYKV
ncbi:sulfotransferase family 2 domain-containing protein [Acidiluteibacter ferrifornacis]|nr:sulfotransferase family 2 domain-containing protein [Acidiluteibacter ferrifornacis]